MARISFWTLVVRAWSGRSMTRGTTTAARMPRMTTTTMTSIRGRPRWAEEDVCTLCISVDQQVAFKGGQQDAEYHAPHCQNQQRLEDPHDHGNPCLQFPFLGFRGPFEHLVQAAAALPALDQAQGHGGEVATALQRMTDAGPFAHSAGSLGHGLAHGGIAYDRGAHVQRVQQGDTAAGKDVQGAGKTGGVQAPYQAPDQRQL